MGPSHPAMHGTVRMVLEVEGERISSADIQIGYLHRCFEKESENATWTQIFPYTDRLNYISPMLNNVGYAMAVEKLLGIDKADPGARAVHPRDRRRGVAHQRPPDLPGRQRDGAGRVHRLPLRAQGARVAVRAARRGVRRAADVDVLPHRRRRLRPARRVRRQAARHPGAHAHRDVGHRQAARAQPHLPRPHGRHRHHHQGRRAGVRHHRPGRPLDRPRLRRPQGPPVPGLRPLRLRRPGRLGRRQLRPLRRARRGDACSRCASSTRRWSRSRPGR